MDIETQSLPQQRTLEIVNKCRKEMMGKEKWVFDRTVGDITLESKAFPECNIRGYRCSVNTSKTPAQLMDAVWNPTKTDSNGNVMKMESAMKLLDPSIESWNIIENSETSRIVRMVTVVPGFKWLFWPRETIIVQEKIFENNGDQWFVTYSTNHPKFPTSSKYVRTTVHWNCFGFCANANQTTTINKITLVSPNGYMPPGIVEYFSGKMVDMTNHLRSNE